MGDGLLTLRSEARRYRGAAYADSTKRTYKTQVNSYVKFCLNYNFVPVPATQDTLSLYMAFLAKTLAASSIPGYMNSVRLLHLEGGFANPIAGNWELGLMKKGISRLKGRPPKQKAPITVQVLLVLFRTLSDSPIDRAFWAASLIAFYGFLRKSTLLPASETLLSEKYISRSDVHDFNLTSFRLSIRYSKTIQFGQRVLILPYEACSDKRLCPVRALLVHLGVSPLTSSRPLFNFIENGHEKFFSHAMFVRRLRSGLIGSCFDSSEMSCHSFRRGGATLAFECGLSPIQIKLRGDWRSNAFEKYLSVSIESEVASAKSLVCGVERLLKGQ
jgi:hypothetical protein